MKVNLIVFGFDTFFNNLNINTLTLAVILSVITIVTDRNRYSAVDGLIAGFALSIFTTALSGTIVKGCSFVIILMFAVKVLKDCKKIKVVHCNDGYS